MWTISLVEETSPKIRDTATQTHLRITTEMCWGHLRPATQGGCHVLPSPDTVPAVPGDGTRHVGEDFALSGAKAEPGHGMFYRKTDWIFLDNLSPIVWICSKGREQLLKSVGRERKQSLLPWSNNSAAASVLSGEIRLEGCESHKEVVFSCKTLFQRPQLAPFWQWYFPPEVSTASDFPRRQKLGSSKLRGRDGSLGVGSLGALSILETELYTKGMLRTDSEGNTDNLPNEQTNFS